MSQPSSLFSLLVVITLALAVTAIVCLGVSRYLRRRSGLPDNEVVYEDTTGADTAEPDGDTLLSKRYGLSGKPDYLLEDEDNLIPVEVKSGRAPRNGRPYQSHLMQLAVYFLLVEDVLRRPAPYGLIRYSDRRLRVANTGELREELFSVIAEMNVALTENSAQRSHDQARRCAGCSMAYACDERLA